MKKITLLLLFVLTAFSYDLQAQSDYYTALPNNNSTSGNGRSPQGTARYNRSIWLITAAEMAASGFTNGSVVNSIGFNLVAAQDVPTTGNFTVYLQNTADATNTKSTTWATAITGMTTACVSTLTIPATVGTYDKTFSGGSVFTYTGGALYVAFDYQNAAGPLATVGNTTLCSNTLTGGLKGAFSPTTNPTTIAASNFRPETRLGKSVTCSRPDGPAVPTNLALTSVDLNWTSAGSAFEVEYGPYNFTQGTGTMITGINATTTPVTSLTASTAYEFYVRTNCGAGNFSVWNGPYPFHTVFQPATPPYNTGFEIEDFPYLGWLAAPSPNGSDWFLNYGGPASPLVQEGVYSAVSLSNATAVADGRMWSRGFNLLASNQTTITYYVRNYVSGSTNTANYILTAGTAQDVPSQTTVVATETGISSATYVLKSFTFTPPSDGVYYFSFLHNSPINAAGTHGLMVDNFSVSQVLGVDQFLASKFSVYPNPVKNMVNITNTTDASISMVAVSDLNGRIIKNVSFSNVSDAQISVSELAQGIYMIKIISDKGSVIKKFIKE